MPIRPRVVYSPHYDIGFFGLERLHPFDSRKYGRAYRALAKQFGRRELRRRTLRPRAPVSRDELLRFHTPPYLDQNLKDRAYLAGAVEVPPLRRVPAWLTDRFVLRPMRWATAGTILAAREAVREFGLVINLSGGYHHASADRGEGFSIYNDIALAVHALRHDGALGDPYKVVYVDCDAHQGNGVCRAYFDDPRVMVYDIYNEFIYPRDVKAQRRIDHPVPVRVGTTEGEYLAALRSTLPPFLDSVTKSGAARFAIYNAGTDVLRGDPLGALAVTAAGILDRDRFVIHQLVDRGLPTIMLPSGGYTRESYQLIATTIADVFTTWPD